MYGGVPISSPAWVRPWLRTDIDTLKREREEIREAAKQYPDLKLDLSKTDRRFRSLESDRETLEKYVTGLEAMVAGETDPKRRGALLKWEQGKSCERQQDYEKANKLFEEAQQSLNNPALAKHIKELNAVWIPKSDEHKNAREFIYTNWLQFDSELLKQKIAKARAAFETCRKAGDYLTPQKILRVAINHSGKLSEFLADLYPGVNPEQKRLYADTLAEGNDLAELMTEVTNYLKESLKLD